MRSDRQRLQSHFAQDLAIRAAQWQCENDTLCDSVSALEVTRSENQQKMEAQLRRVEQLTMVREALTK